MRVRGLAGGGDERVGQCARVGETLVRLDSERAKKERVESFRKARPHGARRFEFALVHGNTQSADRLAEERQAAVRLA